VIKVRVLNQFLKTAVSNIKLILQTITVCLQFKKKQSMHYQHL